MITRLSRFAFPVVMAAALVIPGSALAADPAPVAPPAPVVEWQAHLEHMRSMDGNLGAHVGACVEMHGSIGGLFGANGTMVEMMSGSMMR